jgi:hypothetical protein
MPLTGGAAWQELVVKLTHIAAGLSLVVAWGLLVAGFLKKPTTVTGNPDTQVRHDFDRNA